MSGMTRVACEVWRQVATAAPCLLMLAVLLTSGSATAQDVVDWRDAAQCVGRVCGIRGTVVVVENDGQSTRLYFDPERRDVRVILMRGWLVTWPSYAGATIVATGKVNRFRDHVEMILLDPEYITVLDAPTVSPSPADTLTPTPVATATAVATATLTESPTAVATPAVPPTAAPTPAASAPDTPASPPAPATPLSETEELRQRIRELENRVRELEAR